MVDTRAHILAAGFASTGWSRSTVLDLGLVLDLPTVHLQRIGRLGAGSEPAPPTPITASVALLELRDLRRQHPPPPC